MSRLVNSIDFALRTQFKLFFALAASVLLCRIFWPENTFTVFVCMLLIAVLHALFAVRNTVAKVLCVAGLGVSAQFLEPLCDPTKKIEFTGAALGLPSSFSTGWLIAGGVLLLVVVVSVLTSGGGERREDMDDEEAKPAPTEKQLAYAQKIAKARGLEIPRDCLESRAQMSKFIGRNVRK